MNAIVTLINPNQFFDLSREALDSLTSFQSVLRDGQLFRYVEGSREPASIGVERYFADYFGKEAATAVANGTVGLKLALRALGVGPGDRVLVSAYSFIACAMAITSVGAVPVPMDMQEPLTIDTALLEAWEFPIAAVMVVHVQGHSVPIQPVRELCDRLGVPLIEDVCQALGAGSRHGRAGELADIAVTSFQQAKQVSSGEGGLVAGSAEVIGRAYRMADLGAVRRDDGLPDWDDERAVIGDNLRMTELHAALVLDQAQRLDSTIERQRTKRAQLWELLGDDVTSAIIHSEAPELDSGSHTLFLAKGAASAAEFCDAMRTQGALARIVWRKTYLEYGVFRRLEGPTAKAAQLCWPDQAVALAPRILSVPTSKYLTDSDITRVADAITESRRHLVQK
ncbi:DegT/DnrJ/EryC1/StrS family aminotransferase [Nocardia gipuzkoensis]